MDIPKEIQIQDTIAEFLSRSDISPYSVVFVSSRPDSIPILKMSFWFSQQLDQLKELIGYNSMCDRSGYTEFENNNTVIMTGVMLRTFFRLIEEGVK